MSAEYIHIDREDPLMEDLQKEAVTNLKAFIKDVEAASSTCMEELLNDLYKIADGLMCKFEKIEERLQNQYPWTYHE